MSNYSSKVDCAHYSVIRASIADHCQVAVHGSPRRFFRCCLPHLPSPLDGAAASQAAASQAKHATIPQQPLLSVTSVPAWGLLHVPPRGSRPLCHIYPWPSRWTGWSLSNARGHVRRLKAWARARGSQHAIWRVVKLALRKLHTRMGQSSALPSSAKRTRAWPRSSELHNPRRMACSLALNVMSWSFQACARPMSSKRQAQLSPGLAGLLPGMHPSGDPMLP